jgi:hypothetical protein
MEVLRGPDDFLFDRGGPPVGDPILAEQNFWLTLWRVARQAISCKKSTNETFIMFVGVIGRSRIWREARISTWQNVCGAAFGCYNSMNCQVCRDIYAIII